MISFLLAENLRGLAALESLDLRGNQITGLEDIQELAQLPSLKSLSLKGVDGEDANPVCQHPSYSGVILSSLPSLQILDGGHISIREAFGSIEDELSKLKPDPSICASPPPEPWFSAQDLDLDHVLTNKKSSSTGNSSAVAELENKINDILTEDCSHLLRKATQALSKSTK
eukprot:gene30941-37397_t